MIWTGLVMMDLVILVLLLVLFLLLLLVIITVRYTPIGYSAGIQVHGHSKVLKKENNAGTWMKWFFRRKHEIKFNSNLLLNIFLILF